MIHQSNLCFLISQCLSLWHAEGALSPASVFGSEAEHASRHEEQQ